MLYGLCYLPVIPLKAMPSHRSEMVSQVLFGESFQVLDSKNSWLLVRLAYDDYEGWMDVKQQVEIPQKLYEELKAQNQSLTGLSMHSICLKLGKEEMIHLLPGSTLPFLEDTKFRILDQEYLFLGESPLPKPEEFRSSLEEVSHFYVNSPYLWGGRSYFGLDCSGFSQLVFKHLGIKIFRDARQQVNEGRRIDFLQEATIGDLAFFDNKAGEITHVGIILGDSEIIHASGRVKIDQLDEQGIFCKDTQEYTHKLRVIKRIVE